MEAESIESEAHLVHSAIAETADFIGTVAGRENEPAFQAYAEYGVGWWTGTCQTQHGLEDLKRYRALVSNSSRSAWMDNTTLLTACTLLSSEVAEAMTPLTIWDLATFCTAAVSFDHIYHHEHPAIDDRRVNELLGGDLLVPVPLPFRELQGTRILPDPWDGAHLFMCDVWSDGYRWIRRLHDAIGRDTLDGRQIQTVVNLWKAALATNDLEAREVFDFRDVDHRWRSPSNQLLIDTANVSDVEETTMYLDPKLEDVELFRQMHEAGVRDSSRSRRNELLADLNLRGYVNQRIAEFFSLPYVSAAGRIPFRAHLYDRSLRVQQELTLSQVIDNRYAALGLPTKLRLPVFLALALQGCERPESVWLSLASQRESSSAFRANRAQLDHELARGNLKEARELGKALHTSIDRLLAVAGQAVCSVTSAILEDVSKGDLSATGTGITAAVAATKKVLSSSFSDRLLWRLRRPELLWINSVIDQAQVLTEALPDLARIWGIPPNRQSVFVERFRRMGDLVASR